MATEERELLSYLSLDEEVLQERMKNAPHPYLDDLQTTHNIHSSFLNVSERHLLAGRRVRLERKKERERKEREKSLKVLLSDVVKFLYKVK